MRRAHDDGRLYRLWANGIIDDIPAVIDHGIVGVERDGDEILVLMRDLTTTLVLDRVVTREENRRILDAATRMYEAFWGREIPYLCCGTGFLASKFPRTIPDIRLAS